MVTEGGDVVRGTRGYAFINMADPQAVAALVSHLHQRPVTHGHIHKVLKVSYAENQGQEALQRAMCRTGGASVTARAAVTQGVWEDVLSDTERMGLSALSAGHSSLTQQTAALGHSSHQPAAPHRHPHCSASQLVGLAQSFTSIGFPNRPLFFEHLGGVLKQHTQQQEQEQQRATMLSSSDALHSLAAFSRQALHVEQQEREQQRQCANDAPANASQQQPGQPLTQQQQQQQQGVLPPTLFDAALFSQLAHHSAVGLHAAVGAHTPSSAVTTTTTTFSAVSATPTPTLDRMVPSLAKAMNTLGELGESVAPHVRALTSAIAQLLGGQQQPCLPPWALADVAWGMARMRASTQEM